MFRTVEDLTAPQQQLAFDIASGLWEALVEHGIQRTMECLAIEKVIAIEIGRVRADPVALGLAREEAPSNDREVESMQNLVLQAILEKRRSLGGYVGWKDEASFKRYMLTKYCTDSTDPS